MGKLKRASDKFGLLENPDEPDRVETRGRKKKTAAQDEFNTLTIAVLTLVISLSNIPEQVKPIENEVQIFSNHLTGLLLRHLPISGKFSADALDIIGLIAVASGYYARVAPEIRQLRQPQDQPQGQEQYYFVDPSIPAPVLLDDISKRSPVVGDWLSRQARSATA